MIHICSFSDLHPHESVHSLVQERFLLSRGKSPLNLSFHGAVHFPIDYYCRHGVPYIEPPKGPLGVSTSYCSPKDAVLPDKCAINRGVVSYISQILESEEDIGKPCICPKKQTVILKEQSNWEDAVRVFEQMKSHKEYIPNVIHYNVVFRALGMAHKWHEISLYWFEMARNGVAPTNNTYGMLVDVYGKAGRVKEALFWIKHMKSRGVFPDEVTMSTVVWILKEMKEFDNADKFYRDWCTGIVDTESLDFVSTGSSAPSLEEFSFTELFKVGQLDHVSEIASGVPPKPKLASTYNTLIDLYGKWGKLNDAADVFVEMLNACVSIDSTTVNTMIYTCGSHGLLSEAEALFWKMEERGISADTRTYNAILSVYADYGKVYTAIKYFYMMKEVGIAPDVVTYRIMLHTLCGSRMIKRVGNVVDEIVKVGVNAGEHISTIVVKTYVEEGSLENAKAVLRNPWLVGRLSSKECASIMDSFAEKWLWAEAEDVFMGRDNVGQKQDVREYNVLIKAYHRANLRRKALALFNNMKKRDILPDVFAYNSIIQLCLGRHFVDVAGHILSEMQEAGFRPLPASFRIVIMNYAQCGRVFDASSVFREMEDAGVVPPQDVFGPLIEGFVEIGKPEEALYYFRLMEERKIRADHRTMPSMITVFGMTGHLQEAEDLFKITKHIKDAPGILALKNMLNVYTCLKMASKAVYLFNYLRETGEVDVVSLVKMMSLYRAVGDNNKCHELLQEMLSRKLFPTEMTTKMLLAMTKKEGFSEDVVAQLESSYLEIKARREITNLFE